MLGCFYLSQLLFKKIKDWKSHRITRSNSNNQAFIIKQEHMDKIQDKFNLFGWIQHILQYYTVKNTGLFQPNFGSNMD